MDKSNVVTLVVAICSLLAALSAQRQSTKVSKGNNEAVIFNARTDAETEAYVRARAMDLETIARQAGELKEIRAEFDKLDKKCDELEAKCDELLEQNKRLRERIVELEKH